MVSTITYPIRLEHWHSPATDVCPECKGKGYTTIEIREHATVWAPEYPVTVPVVCYKTRPCWRCKGTGRVREEG